MIKLLILADDFTGGLDTGVQFASRGIPTCVLTRTEEDYESAAEDCEVLVVVAETRHLSAEEAYRTVSAVIRKAVELGVPHIYKKTDSALRGNIGAELTAVMEACGASLLPFIPALPSMDRVTRKGVHYVDGVPVAESVFGRDPFEPVRESNIASLIALQSTMPVISITPEELEESLGIAVIDAETEEDLKRAGEALSEMEGWRVSAGCAGFASVLPELLHLHRGTAPSLPKLDPGLFILCGSVNPITQRQLDFGEQKGFIRIHIPPKQKLDPEGFETADGQAAIAGWRRKMEETPWMILDANDSDPDNHETAELAGEQGMAIEEVRARISESLGLIFKALMQSRAERTLLITGGDTLLQGMNRMNVFRMNPLMEVFPGVVLSKVTLEGRPRYVMTKSGGFGEESLLSDLKDLISNQ